MPTSPTSKMLQLTLHIDAAFEHFKQSANKLYNYYVSNSVTLLHLIHKLKRWMACSHIMEIAPVSLMPVG